MKGKKIKPAWERTSPTLVDESFKKCGISDSLVRPEGDFFQYSDDGHVSFAGDNAVESNGE
jgi:hypothetical protein